MKKHFYVTLGMVGILVSSCNNQNNDDPVVSQRYLHKYGYAVSKQEWDTQNYPGQVVTSLNNGVTITSTYENGYLHGPTTHTYPQSQMIEAYFLYNQGTLVKETHYDPMGMPIKEKVQLSPARYTLTLWYAEGSPLSVEEYVNDEILEGQYFTVNNEVESRIEKGNGLRVSRDRHGALLCKDLIESGYMIEQETFYSSGAPEGISHFYRNKMQGEKCIYAETGEPMLREEWINGKLHGKAIYFQNGIKFREVSYLHGAKNGLEVFYLDGKEICQEINWENDKRHGPSIFYVEGNSQTQWFYDGDQVSCSRYEELVHLDEMISRISSDVKTYEPVQ